MTRGLRPVVAIGEAKRIATAWGFSLIEISMEVTTPFDFAVNDKGITSLVRVRRVKHNAYRVETIRTSCADQIRELQGLALPEGIVRELWVRGPQRAWHRYRILPETIEEVYDVPHPGPSTGITGWGENNDPDRCSPDKPFFMAVPEERRYQPPVFITWYRYHAIVLIRPVFTVFSVHTRML